DRHRRDRPLGAARSDDARCNVHLRQHPAAEDVAVGVDVAWTGNDAQDGRPLEITHSASFSSWIWGAAASSWPLSALRNTRVISAVPSRTVSPAPSAVARIRWMLGDASPRMTRSTAITATTTDSSASNRKIRQKRRSSAWRGFGTGSGRGTFAL